MNTLFFALCVAGIDRIKEEIANITGMMEEEITMETPVPGEMIALLTVLSLFTVVGSVGNGLVLFVFSRVRDKTTAQLFILALALIDLFTCMVIIPFTMFVEYTRYDIKYDFLCKLYQFLITFNVPLAAFIMVAIAVDRYFSICHPFLHAVTPRRARLTVFCLCIFAFSLGTITALGYGYGPYTTVGNVSVGVNSSGEVLLTTASAFDGSSSSSNASAVFGGVGVVVEGAGQAEVLSACQPMGNIISMKNLNYYQKFYASFYLLSLLAVFVIYAFIYRSVVRRREWRRRQRSNRPATKSVVTMVTEVEEVELRAKNGAPAANCSNSNGNGGKSGNCNVTACSETQSLNSSEKKASKERRDFNFLANIRTAAMLFVVTLVFIVSFLPAWLMAVRVLTYHIVVFYLYFVYNVANPVIYAFMNHAFRKELKRVFQRGLNLCRV